MTEVVTQTLHIVARELNNELNDARAALENFGEQQDDARFLENCRDRLHHVYGALRVAEVHGAALLAEEMEQVARYLIDNFAEKRHLAEGLDALMRAMVQLPTYLDRVLGGGRDMALILLPLLNDLRAVRGHALLSEGTLLLLNLSSDKQADPQAPKPGEQILSVASWARKLRPRFQLGMLGWIKDERIEQNMDILGRAAEKLEQVATTQCVFQLWWVVGAVVEALRDNGLESSASIKRLLGQSDREMRRLYELGEQQYSERPPVELLNNLLYYVARATASGPRVAAVRASFRLGELLPVDSQVEAARASLAAPSVKLMKTVAAAIKEDLARVKDAFDIFVRQSPTKEGAAKEGAGPSASQLAPQLELLRKIADTLGVLGLGALRDKVQAEIAELQTVIERKSPQGQTELSEARLMRIASTLIGIEDNLDEQLVGLILPTEEGAAPPEQPDVEFRQVSEAVLRECIVNMARIKEAIALSVEKPREPQVLDQVPDLIRGITAGLLMLGKTRAVQITESIGRSLSRHVHSDGTPVSREAMDRLADAIVAVEYYIETVHAGRSDPWYMLDNAEACLQALVEIAGGTSSVRALPDFGDHATTMAYDHAATVQMDRGGERTQVMSTVQQVTQVIPSQQSRQHAARATPPTPPAPSPPTLVPQADKADPEFVELFIEEAREEIANLQRLFLRWDDNPQDSDALTQIRRSFHTLKGSGRMVGAMAIGELAWAIENMLNRVINRTLERSPELLAVVREAVEAMPTLVEQLESGRASQVDTGDLIARANRIAQVRESQMRAAPPTAETATGSIAKEAAVKTPPRPARVDAPTLVLTPADSAATKPAPAPAMDTVLHDIFSKETAGHLAAIREYVVSCALLTPPYPVTEALHRACHTLRGAAKTAGARQGIKIAEPLNRYIRKLYDNGVGLPPAGLQVLKDTVRAMEMVVDHINEATGYFVTHQSIVERIAALEQQLDSELTQMSVAVDSSVITPALQPEMHAPIHQSRREPPTMSIGEDVVELSFDAAGEDHSLGIESPTRIAPALQMPPASGETVDIPMEATVIQKAQRLFDQQTQAERTVEKPAITLETAIIARESDDGLDDVAIVLESDEHQTQEISIPELIEHTDLTPDRSLDAAIDEIALRAGENNIVDVEANAGESIEIEPVEIESVEIEEVRSTHRPEPASAVEADVDDNFDADVAAIFTEEATELLDLADASLSSWSRDRANKAALFELKRAVHTLKGGARMAGIRAMGNLSHELETFVERVESGSISSEPNVIELLQGCLDELQHMRDAVSGGRPVVPAQALIGRLHALAGIATPEEVSAAPAPKPAPQVAKPAPAAPPAAQRIAPTVAHLPAQPIAEERVDLAAEFAAEELAPPASEPIAEEIEFQSELESEPEPELEEAAAPMPLPGALPGREQVRDERQQEVARVDAELLDTLLNNAGEVSILRSRVEQQINSVEFNLAELNRTVTRLKEQLRNMEMETEAQILHRHQEDKAGRDDFDPLELDRYSQIQQLSRALAESVSDVASIEGLLESLTREAQNLLLQQSRVVTEVQNGLMRTRMVPFQRHVQRLSRIVRQVAAETHKRAELAVTGASGELDRQVLERMLPPFEHMLRNSVVHGIETPEQRRTAGKSESGTIKIGLHREGSEMVIVVEDDGRGIDVKAVRERAIQRGLLKPGRTLTDEEAMQLVLEPGFSTASSITQHAGRGVGMDVVVAEIKKLGGALFTQSTPGHGVRFTIRLPFTLAIAQSLIVRVGEEQYAIPLPTVEGVARISRGEVISHLQADHASFGYGGQMYRIQYLGAFIGAPASTLPDADVPVPVILIRAGEHSTGLVVDELVGNREIVVKPVGPQVASIRGVAGATILGDGRIIIILDMGALVRSEWRTRHEVAAPAEDRRSFALVVDDSITVRRVTQRLLERNGMRVMTAKDGVDALEMLQDHLPDIILLDIEMPRMDGYELASRVRADARLADIPIVMITSRVGEKHRARAIELGVNDYLGKPYQENQLLDAIEPLIEAARRRRSASKSGASKGRALH